MACNSHQHQMDRLRMHKQQHNEASCFDEANALEAQMVVADTAPVFHGFSGYSDGDADF